jgi:hypothetical protein
MIRKIIKNLSNLPGWRTNRKIIVIESDDWGSVRMPSKEVLRKMSHMDMGHKSRQRFSMYDTLASKEDLTALYEILIKFEDLNGKSPVFTAISLVANPDFEKIKASNFKEYYYEPFTVTLKKYNQENAIKAWQEGIENKLFIPQFHGREHLNVQVWMRQLQAKDKKTHEAFNLDCWGYANTNKYNVNYQAAFDLEFSSDVLYQEAIIVEGLSLFEQIHGYKADFFVPPNGPFNNTLEKTAAKAGIKYMSASKIQLEPQGSGKKVRKFHWLGQKNKYHQVYITRNCFFEPSNRSKDWVESCLDDIESAFSWKKPAVISSHRLNYIGGLDEKNRQHGLKELVRLLNNILQKWPEVEFLTSSELGYLIKNRND